MNALRFVPLIALTGCATVQPAYWDAAITHVSHATQHAGEHHTEYGYNMAAIGAHWEPTSRLHIDVTEGVVLEPCIQLYAHTECGGLYGPREVFTATVGYRFWRKP
jgi:hypothetical protein